MKKILLLLSIAGAAHAQSAGEVLKLLDQARHDFNDLTLESKMTIYEPGAATGRVVTFTTMVKGDKRLIRFTGPPDVRGMGLLTEGRDTMYALLPAFGNRIRRMGTHAKNQSFMGSDVPNEDLAGGNYADAFTPKLVGTEGNSWVVELTLMPGKEGAFPKQKLWVDKTSHQIVKTEFMNDKGESLLTMTSGGWVKDDGSSTHWSPRSITYVDHARNDHKTTVEMASVKANQGLSDDVFTQRGLQRGN